MGLGRADCGARSHTLWGSVVCVVGLGRTHCGARLRILWGSVGCVHCGARLCSWLVGAAAGAKDRHRCRSYIFRSTCFWQLRSHRDRRCCQPDSKRCGRKNRPCQDGRYGKNSFNIVDSGARYNVYEPIHTSDRLTGRRWLTYVTHNSPRPLSPEQALWGVRTDRAVVRCTRPL